LTVAEPLVKVTFDQAKLAAVARAMADCPRLLPRIVYRALTRTASGGRTQLDKLIRGKVSLRKRSVMDRIVDAERASYTNWRWRLDVSARRLSVTSFLNARQTRAGVVYGGGVMGQRLIPRAFITPGFTQSQTGEYYDIRSPWRRRKAGEKGAEEHLLTKRGDMVRRLPLMYLRGPSLAKVVTDTAGMLQAVHAEGQGRLEREMDGQVKYELERRLPR
jgi:hypothetical protein